MKKPRYVLSTVGGPSGKYYYIIDRFKKAPQSRYPNNNNLFYCVYNQADTKSVGKYVGFYEDSKGNIDEDESIENLLERNVIIFL